MKRMVKFLYCLLFMIFSVQGMRAWAYTERYSLYNDTPEDAENIGKIGASGITISGSCSYRWQIQDDDYYKFTTSSSKLYYRVEIDVVKTSIFEMLSENTAHPLSIKAAEWLQEMKEKKGL